MSGIDFGQLLEDVQKDIEDAELEIVELKGIQSYVQRKKENPSESRLRPELLDELLTAVDEDLQAVEDKIPELEGVRKYAQMKAGGPILKNVKKQTPPPPGKPIEQRDAPKPPPSKVVDKEPTPSAKPFQPSGDDEPDVADSGSKGGKDMRTVVFGPDGFPVGD